MRNWLRSKIAMLASILMLSAGISVLPALPASAAVNGTVECDAGSSYPVVGVWINSSNDAHDGWAAWYRLPGQPNKATYSKSNIASGESYKVHVGCGGTTSN